jgi:hypothetical protein
LAGLRGDVLLDSQFSFEQLTRRSQPAIDLYTWLLRNPEEARDVVGQAALRTNLLLAKQKAHRGRAIRSKAPKRGHRESNQAYLSSDQMFDLALMEESMIKEKYQERQGFSPTITDRIKRFIKHLIMISMEHNSSWAAVAVLWILCDYKLSEVERFYEVIAPNRAVKENSGYYSIRDAVVEDIEERFSPPHQIVLGGHCPSISPSDERVQLIRECFERFRPSHKDFVVPKGYYWRTGSTPLIPYDEEDPRGDEGVEVDRMCLLFHPTNFNRIAESLDLRPLESSVRELALWALSTTKNPVS